MVRRGVCQLQADRQLQETMVDHQLHLVRPNSQDHLVVATGVLLHLLRPLVAWEWGYHRRQDPWEWVGPLLQDPLPQDLLGEDVAVVSAFQNVAAAHLQEGRGVDCDVLVCGNKKDARAQVITLIEAAGMRGFHAGMINNAAAAEALTSVLIVINKQYSCHAGIRITGLGDE